MTNTASASTGNSWDIGFFHPQPTQDSQLLKDLGFIPGLKEALMVRQVHALEHATAWILEQGINPNGNTNDNFGGMSTDKGFYLYGSVDSNALDTAVKQALSRLKGGEWNLAVHPRCGTNLSVAILLTTGLALGANFFFPKDPLQQILSFSVAAKTAFEIAPDLGSAAQKYLTTSIPFNISISKIYPTKDFWGNKAYFVEVEWQDS